MHPNAKSDKPVSRADLDRARGPGFPTPIEIINRAALQRAGFARRGSRLYVPDFGEASLPSPKWFRALGAVLVAVSPAPLWKRSRTPIPAQRTFWYLKGTDFAAYRDWVALGRVPSEADRAADLLDWAGERAVAEALRREVDYQGAIEAVQVLWPGLFEAEVLEDDRLFLTRCNEIAEVVIRRLQIHIGSDWSDIPWERRNAVRVRLLDGGHPACAPFLRALDRADDTEQALYVDPYDLQPDDDPSPPDADWRSDPHEGGIGA